MANTTNPNKILAIIAALNEEDGIGLTIDEMRKVLGPIDILVVDGNSIDNTAKVAMDRGAEVIYQDAIGKGDAIAAAIRYSKLDVDYVILTDADYTYPSQYLPEMLDNIKKDPSVGMVCGNRFNGHIDPRALKNFFYVGNRLLAFSHNMLNGVALRDPLTGLRVVRADILKGWSVRSKGFDVEVELNHHVERRGYTISEVPIKYRKRIGEKKLKARHGILIFSRILRETLY